MKIAKKIKAGALQYVLVISVIIAIIIFAFISLVYLQQKMTIKHGFTKEAIANVQMSFEYLKQKNIDYNTETTLNFSEDENEKEYKTTTILKKHWGIFDLGVATSKVKNEFFQKVALLGTQNKKRDALYLKENNASLVLVGKTKITGTVSIPKQGVKTGNIAGVSYYGNQLIYGLEKTSSAQLPKIKNIEFLKDFIKNYYTESTTYFELEDGLKVHQSFKENTLLFEDVNPIQLRNINLNGNILIVSKQTITVQASAKLEDVILIAPKIIIEENTIGNFQVIATKQIKVKSNVNLHYPSALILLDQDKEVQKQAQNNIQNREINQIEIQENTDIRGILVYESENKQSNYDAQIKIAEKVQITGEVYCAKNTELQGTIYGSVFTNNFIIKKSGRVYVNHIYNGVINAKELPNQYAGLQINQFSNQVAKWVD
ncbi:hypothetical protein [Polaribacter glomeratus]|uniref:Polymer-forming cytoskeletal protein n=1 Tax=Polaribacter glomeratus TaxID=102 RepID=A0A2S7WGU9_9FLAO|nr:hypothetical protein [Polaribacter glomeratus]PQJ76531.1 hypothetical protein BTO16_11540 [Polaribacter glomeratus]TXD64165.1 hypothetical protein ESX12_15755 [Polaribacter glomeratus]